MSPVPDIESKSIVELIDEGTPQTRNHRMQWIVLDGVRQLGGKASLGDVRDFIVSPDSAASEQEVAYLVENEKTARSLLNAARSALMHHGIFEKDGRSWAMTPTGAIVSTEAELHFITRDEPKAEMETEGWQDQIIQRLLDMDPAQFERFVGKLLGKAGVFDVEVTGKTADGGIDGKGSTVRGPLSTPVYFQAKRYAGSVSSATVRDFRGAVQGRGHLGMIFTTGTFTKDAIEEAARTQAVNIQLFDGARLADWLKELRMGVAVETRVVEDVSIIDEWWDGN